MSFGIEDVSSFLGLLSRHAEVIGRAYTQRTVDLDEDNEIAIHKLAQKRVLVRYGETEYRLARSLRDLLDVAFQRQRHYAISENFGEQIARLYKLAEDYQAALFGKHLDDAELYEEEFGEGVFDICDSIDSSLLRLRTLTSTSFANVRTVEEKIRQNAHYMEYAKRLGDAITLLECNDSLVEVLEMNSVMAPLLAMYQRISAHLPGWRRQHSATMTQLREFFYRIRQIQPRARRMRNMAMYLRNNPDYKFPDVDTLTSLPAWAGRFEGLSIAPAVDIFDAGVQESLTDVAVSLKTQKVIHETRRSAGKLKVVEAAPAVEEVVMRPIDSLFVSFIDDVEVSQAPLSASGWWLEKAANETVYASLSERDWLMKLMNAMNNLGGRVGRYRALRYRFHLSDPAYVRAGNAELDDIEVWKARA